MSRVEPLASQNEAPRWKRLLAEETGGFSLRRCCLRLLESLLPAGVGGRMRAGLYRSFGCRVGRGTILQGPLDFSVSSRLENLRLGAHCFVNTHVFVDAAAPVTLGDGVSVGHHVVIITTDHAFGPPEFRAGTREARPVTIGAGAWIAAGVTLLPGVTVGAGVVVAAGATVTKDVPPNTLVGGLPAKFIRVLD